MDAISSTRVGRFKGGMKRFLAFGDGIAAATAECLVVVGSAEYPGAVGFAGYANFHTVDRAAARPGPKSGSGDAK